MDREKELFSQRLFELCDRCRTRYSVEFTHFLDGHELFEAKKILAGQPDVVLAVFGGFEGAERCVVGIFPSDIYSETDEGVLFEMFDVSGIEISGSGFNSFTHRDVLGAVLALGVKRETLGDIYVDEKNFRAYLCMHAVAAQYVCENLEFVARDKVRRRIVPAACLPVPERKFAVICGTVSQTRLDCIVSLVTKTSREKAKLMIGEGLVSVNHVPVTKCDCNVEEKSLLSIRGHGRFSVEEAAQVTKKGRIKVVVHKMI